MLTQIYVKNFILMDEVQLELHDNMSAFTGETGAGKSLHGCHRYSEGDR